MSLLAATPLDPSTLVESIWTPEDFADFRLYKRMRISAAMLFDRFDDPTTHQPRAVRRGFQRLCDNLRVNSDTLAQRPLTRTLLAVRPLPVVLLIHDTTEVNKVGPSEPKDAGPLRSNVARGYLVHSTVAVDPAHRSIVGVLTTQAWTRSWKLRDQKHKSRAPHKKESIKWRRGIRRVVAALPQDSNQLYVHIMDREGDVHENFQFALRHKHLVIVRAAQDRLIEEGVGKLWGELACRKVQHVVHQEVRTKVSSHALAEAKKQQEAGDKEAVTRLEARVAKLGAHRTAQVQIRFATVTLVSTRKHKRRKPVKVEAIFLREVNAPKNVEPVDDVLLTTCPVRTAQQALVVVDHYNQRYLIEPVHRMWKSGFHLEREPVSDLASFKRQLAILVPMATHLAQWTYASRETPQAPAAPHITEEMLEDLKEACRYHKLTLPRRPWTIKDLVIRLAQLGGYEPRPDRQPGWIVIWRGWREFRRFVALFEYARSRRKEAPG
jgi:Transposase DDE domain